MVATDFTDLNFIVEHCGLPRLEDFCWIATQEPNVTPGSPWRCRSSTPGRGTSPRSSASSSTGSARTGSCSRSDYAIWTPKWLIESSSTSRSPTELDRVRAAHHRPEEEDPRAERGARCTTSRCQPGCDCRAAERAEAAVGAPEAPTEPRLTRARPTDACRSRVRHTPRPGGRGDRSRAGRTHHGSRLRAFGDGGRRQGRRSTCGCPPRSARRTSPT